MWWRKAGDENGDQISPLIRLQLGDVIQPWEIPTPPHIPTLFSDAGAAIDYAKKMRTRYDAHFNVFYQAEMYPANRYVVVQDNQSKDFLDGRDTKVEPMWSTQEG